MQVDILTRRLGRAPALMALAGLALAGGAALGTPPAQAAANSSSGNFVSVCGAPTPGRAACMAERRTDVRSVHAGAVPAVAPAGYGPSDLRQAYNLTADSTQTVAIVDAYDDPTAESDMATYRFQYALPSCTSGSGCFTKVGQTGGTPPSGTNAKWEVETSLDLDMVSAICPSCHILLVEAADNMSTNLYPAEDYAAGHAKFVSNSWDVQEYAAETIDDGHFNHRGVAITVSSGDTAFGALYPATSQYVTAVGGTTLSRASNARGWTESAWSDAGSGCSAYEPRTAWEPVFQLCNNREEADVSAVADPNTGVAVYQTGPGWEEVGGTSAAAPIIASVYALAGTPGPNDYPVTYPYTYPAQLNDVTTGSNGFCPPTPMCSAGPGWDGPTGLGTPNTPSAFTPEHAWKFSPAGASWQVSNASANLPPGAVGKLSYDAPYIWARGADGHLRGYTQSNGQWTAVDVTALTFVTITDDPEALGGSVYATDINGDLRQFYVNNGQWISENLSVFTGVPIVGDFSPQPGGGGLARDTNNHLREFSVSNNVWTAFDVTAATGVTIASSPYTDSGGATYVRDTNNDLRQFYVSNGAWVDFDVTAATGASVAGDPVSAGGVTYSDNASGHLLQFYVSGGHWVYFDVSAATGQTIVGDPATYSGNEYGRTAAGHLVELYVSNGAWTTLDITAATSTPIAGDPVATAVGVLTS